MTDQFILLVEDDSSDRELIIHALRKRGVRCEVAVARDGAEALEFLFATGQHAGRNLDTMPALVLLDLHLPRVGGLEVLRRIRSNRLTEHVPVVIITSVWNPEQIVCGFRLNADGFICKTSEVEKLSDALGNLALDVLLGRQNRSATLDVLRGIERNHDSMNTVPESRATRSKSRRRPRAFRNPVRTP